VFECGVAPARAYSVVVRWTLVCIAYSSVARSRTEAAACSGSRPFDVDSFSGPPGLASPRWLGLGEC